MDAVLLYVYSVVTLRYRSKCQCVDARADASIMDFHDGPAVELSRWRAGRGCKSAQRPRALGGEPSTSGLFISGFRRPRDFFQTTKLA